MKRKAISRILAISLSVAMCAQSIPIYAAEEIGTSAAADFFAEDSIENQSLNEGDAETNTDTNTETNAETNTESHTETNTKPMRQPAYRKRIRWKRVIQRPHRRKRLLTRMDSGLENQKQLNLQQMVLVDGNLRKWMEQKREMRR